MAVGAVGPVRMSAGQAPAQTAPAPDPKGQAVLNQDAAVLQKVADAAASGQAASAIPITWQTNHFLKSSGDTVYIPFSVTIDRSKVTAPSLALYVRAVNRAAAAPADAPAAAAPAATPPAGAPAPGASAGAPVAGAAQPAAAAPARPTYAWEQIYEVSELPGDGQVARALAVTPGTYDVFVAVKPLGGADAATAGVLRKELVVPTLSDTELSTSSVILLRGVEQLAAPLPADKQVENPYVINVLKLTPSLDGVFPKSGPFELMFWIYGASQKGGKPDVQIDYNFHTRAADGSTKYFNKTAPQKLNAEGLPPEFNLTAGHQLIANLQIPLGSFPAGDYRLEIKVTDTPSGKTLTQHVDFTVSA
jgi:hypothetical protein